MRSGTLKHEPERTEIILLIKGDTVLSYAVIWYGGKFSIQDIYEIYLWNPTTDILTEIRISPGKRADIQLYNDTPTIVEAVISRFRSLGFKRFNIGKFHDMICGRDTFRPSHLESIAVKLGEEHAHLYQDLELERGVEVSLEEAKGDT